MLREGSSNQQISSTTQIFIITTEIQALKKKVHQTVTVTFVTRVIMEGENTEQKTYSFKQK